MHNSPDVCGTGHVVAERTRCGVTNNNRDCRAVAFHSHRFVCIKCAENIINSVNTKTTAAEPACAAAPASRRGGSADPAASRAIFPLNDWL